MVAVFSVCFRVFQLLQRVANVSGTILLSHVVQRERRAGYRMTMIVSRNIFLFSFVFCILGMLAGKGMIRLIADSTYLSAYFPLMLMLPGIVAINAGSVINGMYWGHGYPYKIILAPYWVAAIGLALDVFMIPRWGVRGAATSFTMMSLVWFAFIVIAFKKDSGYPLNEIIFTRREDLALVLSRVRKAFPGVRL